MDCKQALLKLYNYLDSELDTLEIEEIEEHLRACRGCFIKAEFERIMKEVVRDKCEKEQIPSYLKDKIQERIRQIDSAESTDDSQKAEDTSSFFFRPPIALFSAAAVAILFLVGILALSEEGSAGTAGQMVAEYESLSANLPVPEGSNGDILTAAFDTPRPDFIPRPISEQSVILMANMETRSTGRMNSVAFKQSGSILLFYCVDVATFDPGEKLREFRAGGINYSVYAEDADCRVIIWKCNGCFDALVGNASVDELLALASILH